MAVGADIYEKLQKHLDDQPVGFPRAKDGADIRVLKAFFTPEEAALATCLGALPNYVKSIFRGAKKQGLATSVEETKAKLDAMVKKGLITTFRDAESGELMYMNFPFAIGFYEFSIDRLNKEKAVAADEYMPTFMEAFTRFPQLRTIPIDTAISHENTVMAYDDAVKLLEAHPGPFGVADCICTQNKKIQGQPCKHGWTERCLTNSKWYIKEGHAREITREEAIAIVKRGMKEGLVIQPGNYQDPGYFCLCCGDCCGVLTTAKKTEKPALLMKSSFYSEVDKDTCTSCETCVEKCPMDAIQMKETAVVNKDRCIGCGVCVANCPSEAVHLHNKTEPWVPPKGMMDMYTAIAKAKYAQDQKGKP